MSLLKNKNANISTAAILAFLIFAGFYIVREPSIPMDDIKISTQEAMKIAQDYHDGDIVESEFFAKDGFYYYEYEYSEDENGHEAIVLVNATTGEPMIDGDD